MFFPAALAFPSDSVTDGQPVSQSATHSPRQLVGRTGRLLDQSVILSVPIMVIHQSDSHSLVQPHHVTHHLVTYISQLVVLISGLVGRSISLIMVTHHSIPGAEKRNARRGCKFDGTSTIN